jgi:hypothetical protein
MLLLSKLVLIVASLIAVLNVITALLNVYVWFLFFRTIRKRTAIQLLSVITVLVVAVQISVIFHSYQFTNILARLISIMGTTCVFLVILINLRVLDTFRSINDVNSTKNSERTEKILIGIYLCTFITLWLDLIPNAGDSIRMVQRLLAVIWMSSSVFYDSFLSFYLQYMVSKSHKKTGQLKSGLPKIMQINILVMLLDWLYIIFFVLGQFVFSFVDLGRDLRQTAVALSGLHVVGKTYVLYLMMKLLVNPATFKKPTDPGKIPTREAKISDREVPDTYRSQ